MGSTAGTSNAICRLTLVVNGAGQVRMGATFGRLPTDRSTSQDEPKYPFVTVKCSVVVSGVAD